MTQRERQILQLIEENPMISQEEIARQTGITRSAVSVHISNLMKKGYIAGKGYIVKSGTYCAVVGGVNIDIMGQSYNKLIPEDSNPGFSMTSLGGVGRNIAHNLSLLDVDVRFLTAFGDDEYAQRIEASCAKLGIDISHALKVKNASSSTYMFINNPEGNMVLAVSDMKICEEITPQYLQKQKAVLDNAQIIIIDANIPEESIAWITENCSRPVFADPVSVSKAEKMKPYLGKINTIKPNLIEAQLLSGVRITDESSLKEAARTLLDTGLHRAFISMGSKGVLCADQQDMRLVKPIPAAVRNTTGAGDAFMAGLAWAYLQGTNLADAGMIASAASAIAIEGEETINPDMSPENLKKRMLAI